MVFLGGGGVWRQGFYFCFKESPRACELHQLLDIIHLSLVLNLVMPQVGLRNGDGIPNEHAPALHHIIHHHRIASPVWVHQAKCASRLMWDREGEKNIKGLWAEKNRISGFKIEQNNKCVHGHSLRNLPVLLSTTYIWILIYLRFYAFRKQ